MKKYFSFVTFSHSIFALPFAIIGYILGVEQNKANVDINTLVLMFACMIFARNSAMSFNRIVDRDIDKLNERTKNREIPSGKINILEGIIFCLLNSILFVVTTYFINQLCFILSFVALGVILGYSYTKRFTWLCHWILGLSLSLAPIGAYLIVFPSWDILPIFFSLCVLFWVAGFDILYALQDEKFDKKVNLFSVPRSFGEKKAKVLSILSHILSTLFLLSTILFFDGKYFYWIGVGFFVFFIIYQQWLVHKFGTKKINRAFFTANGLSSFVFMLFFGIDRWLQ